MFRRPMKRFAVVWLGQIHNLDTGDVYVLATLVCKKEKKEGKTRRRRRTCPRETKSFPVTHGLRHKPRACQRQRYSSFFQTTFFLFFLSCHERFGRGLFCSSWMISDQSGSACVSWGCLFLRFFLLFLSLLFPLLPLSTEP